MATIVVLLLVLVGLLLIVLEFFVVPGVTVAGIGGVLMIAGGVFMAYRTYGTSGGHIALAGSVLCIIAAVVIALRSNSWNRLMLNTNVDGKFQAVVSEANHPLVIGDEGVALTRLNPIGKARFGKTVIEAHCPGKFVDQQTKLIVKKVFDNHVVVTPIES